MAHSTIRMKFARNFNGKRLYAIKGMNNISIPNVQVGDSLPIEEIEKIAGYSMTVLIFFKESNIVVHIPPGAIERGR